MEGTTWILIALGAAALIGAILFISTTK